MVFSVVSEEYFVGDSICRGVQPSKFDLCVTVRVGSGLAVTVTTVSSVLCYLHRTRWRAA